MYWCKAATGSSTGESKTEMNTYYKAALCGLEVPDELCARYDMNGNSK